MSLGELASQSSTTCLGIQARWPLQHRGILLHAIMRSAARPKASSHLAVCRLQPPLQVRKPRPQLRHLQRAGSTTDEPHVAC